MTSNENRSDDRIQLVTVNINQDYLCPTMKVTLSWQLTHRDAVVFTMAFTHDVPMDATATIDLNLCNGGIANRILGKPIRLWQAIGIGIALWLPMLVLILISRNPDALEGFWNAHPVHVRFLVSVPILLTMSERINMRVRLTTRYLINSGLIHQGDRAELLTHIARVNKYESYVWTEVALFVLLFGLSFFYEPESIARQWQSASPLAYAWMRHVALPLFQVATFHWLLRLIFWAWILLKASRSRIRILPHHPDGVGGLAFLAATQQSFTFIVFAFAAVIASKVNENIDLLKWPPSSVHIALALLYIVMVVFLLGPLLLFTPLLLKNKRSGVLQLSQFSNHCSNDFQTKWLTCNETDLVQNAPMQSPDISAMADLIRTQQQAQNMRVLLVDKKSLRNFGIAAVAPLVPVYLSKFGWNSLLELAQKILA